ncbi:LysM peptidoglycan-binding domain-containing protein [Moraxella sp. ZY200743]|uniref:LysM peptidoglycan-binding domain-containing protein n=1 Tax=Moraxella sp. ZY200743 TaxID=2911970 RepID=UPI003D7EBF6F
MTQLPLSKKTSNLSQKTPKQSQLPKPLTLAVSACLLAACSTTNTTPTPSTASVSKPIVTKQSKPISQPSRPVAQPSSYAGVLDEGTLDELEELLQATDMSMVESDALTVQRYGNLWDRLRRGYRMGETNNARIEAQKSWFYSRQSYLNRLTARASRYLYHTVTEAERRGIPTELALLPIIESSYDPSATSNAAAAGLWQFIPSTGRIYGLNQTSGYDGRRDVIESTRAAYDFLTSLYNQFGSWELALAAYNAGPGRVSRAIRANEAAGLPTDYWSLNLPKETMNYVPRFIAVSQIVASPSSYGVSLPAIANHSHFRTVPVNYGVSLQEVASVTGVSFDELRLLNPALISLMVDSAGPNRIVVPDSLSNSINAKLSALTGYSYHDGGNYVATAPAQSTQYVLPKSGAVANTNSQKELMQSNTLPTTIAQVTANNTIVQEPALTQEERDFIATQIQSATPEMVQAVNPNDGNIKLDAIQTAQSVLEARGQTKTLSYSAPATTKSTPPAPTPVPPPVVHHAPTPAVNTPVIVQPTPPKSTPKPVVANPKPKTPQTPPKPKVAPESYTVKSGDTLTGIAAAHNLSVSQLASYNNITTNTYVQRGQKLWLVPGKVKEQPIQASTQKPTSETTKSTNTKTTNYRVKAGDSLTVIARRHNISLHELATMNDLEPTYGVLIGQVLKVPADTTAEPTRSSQVATTKTNAKTNSTATTNYTVKAGDTLTGVANSLGVSTQEIAALNDFSPTANLIRGQTIKVPAKTATASKTTDKKSAIPSKYTVKSGDSLTSVASKHGISIDELAAANNMTRTSNLILGATITIPVAGDTQKPSKSERSVRSSTPSFPTENYTVQAGDNLTVLANKYDISLAELAKANNLSANAQLRRGQTIKVPKLTTTYKVKSGDNLTSLARRYSISIEQLIKMNNLENNTNLRIGQTLIVPNK